MTSCNHNTDTGGVPQQVAAKWLTADCAFSSATEDSPIPATLNLKVHPKSIIVYSAV